MGGFYKVSNKQLLSDLNTLFKAHGIPALQKSDFISSPFSGSWHGEYEKSIQGYLYEFSRLRSGTYLERIDAYIVSGERWIQLHLNIFQLSPKPASIDSLGKYDGVKFGIPPNSLTKMRLRSDDYKGPPLFHMLFLPEHKIGRFYTKSGYERQVDKLGKLIRSDLENIDGFVKSWYGLHRPILTDWEGSVITKKNVH